MNKRFNQVNSSYRDNIMRVNIRQQMAHPMSEFLGTILIVVVLWFGGILVLDYGRIDGPTIIFYLVMLYSIINPLKEFSKASYNIPKGLASMERIDKILQAEVEIKDKENMLEDWHDAEQIRDEALQLFSHGIVDLKTRAERPLTRSPVEPV